MVESMNEKSIIFAMANPNPEIMPDEARKALETRVEEIAGRLGGTLVRALDAGSARRLVALRQDALGPAEVDDDVRAALEAAQRRVIRGDHDHARGARVDVAADLLGHLRGGAFEQGGHQPLALVVGPALPRGEGG